jgi:phosphatidylinositol alpha-1,6-mannosyltransferase
VSCGRIIRIRIAEKPSRVVNFRSETNHDVFGTYRVVELFVYHPETERIRITVKIMWLSANFHPDLGGIETYVARTTDTLSLTSSVFLVTDSHQYLPEQSNVHHEVCNDLGGTECLARSAQCRARLLELARKIKPDAIHLATAGMAIYGPELSGLAPLVCSVHGNDLTSPWQVVTGGSALQQIVAGLGSCKSIIAVSHYTAGLLRDNLPNRAIEVIQNTCDIRQFYRRPVPRDHIFQLFGIPRGSKVILTVGRLERRKGHFLILDALRSIDANWYWIIVGSGSLRKRFAREVRRAGLEHRTAILGRIALDDLAILYNICDLFVLAPLILTVNGRIDSEGFGLVFQEAGACGVPVIGTRGSGVAEAVSDGETGILVSPGDSIELRDAIRWMLSHPEEASEMGARAARLIHAGGGWAGVVNKLADIYHKLMAG